MSRRRRYGFAKPHLVALFTLIDGLGSMLAAAARALRPPPPATSPRRILFINLAHIGDVLMATPALRAVRTTYPEAHITVLTGPWSKDVLLANPHLDEVLVFRPSWWDREGGAYWRPGEFLSFVRLLRQGRYDLSINLKSFFQENMALWLAGIPARVGYGIYGGGFLLTDQVDFDWDAHTVERNLALVEGLSVILSREESGVGFPPPPQGPHPNPLPLRRERGQGVLPRERETEGESRWRNRTEMFVFDEDVRAAEEFLEAELGSVEDAGGPEAGLVSRADPPLVAFHVGAGYPSKLWGVEKFAALANELASRWAARILVVGGADDAPLVARLQELTHARLIVAAGKLNIRQTAAVIARCDLLVGNDSGPAHLAAAIGVPAIALFSGENDASVWRPYADNCLAIQHHPDCWPCGLRNCPRDHRCMETITVEEVLAAVQRI